MKQVDMKEALLQSEEFRNAYTELKKRVQEEGHYWFIDSLDVYPDIVPVIFHEEHKVKYGDLWLVFAEIKHPDVFPNASQYGCVVADEEEYEEI